MRQGDPDATSIGQKLHVHSIRVACRNGGNDGLEHAMHILAAPAVFYFKVVVHAFKSVVQPHGAGQIVSAKDPKLLETIGWKAGPQVHRLYVRIEIVGTKSSRN